ncbi:MAG: hypothetical protein KDD52_01985 [Bdellovibrionales bacterium]|nr:hypothetical protein [Bdellovibrionales bacterium]
MSLNKYFIIFLAFVLFVSLGHAKEYEKAFTKLYKDQAIAKRLAKYAQDLSQYKECKFLVFAYYPKDMHRNPEGFCIYEIQESRGIFVDTACVAKTIYPDRKTEQNFYKDKGHWGIHSPCIENTLKKEFSLDKPKIKTPKSDFSEKKSKGKYFFLLKDDLHFWDFFLAQIDPQKS